MFPMELKRLPNWVGHLQNKTPMNPKNGSAASSSDRSTWGTYEEAQNAAKKYGWAGIGFMFEPPYIGIDLDDCMEAGGLNAFARRIIAQCGSYAEYSPSKTGIHIIAKGTIPHAVKRSPPKYPNAIEIYQSARYFTVTENPIQPVRPLRTVDVKQLWPEFFEARVLNGATGNQAGWIAESLANLSPGNFHNEFIRIIGKLHNSHWAKEDIFALLKPHAERVGSSIDALRTRVESISKYPVREAATVAENAVSIEEFLKSIEPVEWIAPPIIAHKTIGFVAGLPETMKTWLLVDLAVECARGGGTWLNRFPVKKARVLFIDQERFKGETQRRFNAVIAAKNLDYKQLKNSLFVRCGTNTRVDIDASYEAFKKELSDIRPDLVLIDSFKTFHTKSETSSQDMQFVLDRLKMLRTEFGCSFLFIHHEPKKVHQQRKENRRNEQNDDVSALDAAGSVDLSQTAESFFNVVRQDSKSSFVHHTKNSLGTKVAPFLVRVIDLNEARTKIAVEAF